MGSKIACVGYTVASVLASALGYNAVALAADIADLVFCRPVGPRLPGKDAKKGGGQSIISGYGELMALNNFTLIGEPSGDLYLRLIDYLVSKSEQALLAVRDREKLGEEASRLLQKLEPYLHRREQSDRWPGTVLMKGNAEVLYYRLTPELADLLKSVSSLYRWQHPHLPEDLCFLRQTGEPLFTSIAHEHDAYFSLSEEEFRTLLTEAPDIARILRRDEA